MREIKLNDNKIALVDDDDFLELVLYPYDWRCYLNGNTWYAYSSQKVGNKWQTVSMHREILGANKVDQIDHINGNGLDNRKENLRIVSHSQNGMNRKINRTSKSGYKGVHWNSKLNKYVACIKLKGHLKYLGQFQTKEAAALAYNYAARKLFGEFANLNMFIKR